MKTLCCLLSFLFFAYHCYAQDECRNLIEKVKISQEEFATFVGKSKSDYLTWVHMDATFKDQFEYCSPVSFGPECTNSFVVYEATKSAEGEPITLSFNFYNKTSNQITPYTFLSWSATSTENSKGLVFKTKENGVKVFKWDNKNKQVNEIDSNWPDSFKQNIYEPFVLFYTNFTKGFTIFTSCKGPKSWVLVNKEVAHAFNGVRNLKGQIQKELEKILKIKNLWTAEVTVNSDVQFKELFQNHISDFNFVKEEKPSETEKGSNHTTPETTESKHQLDSTSSA